MDQWFEAETLTAVLCAYFSQPDRIAAAHAARPLKLRHRLDRGTARQRTAAVQRQGPAGYVARRHAT